MSKSQTSDSRDALRDTLRNLLVASAVFVFVLWIGGRLFPSLPAPDRGAPPIASDSAPRAAPSAIEMPQSSDDGSSGAGNGVPTVREAPTVERFAIGSRAVENDPRVVADSLYRMRLVLSNIGASIESALMTDHAEIVDQPARYQLLRPVGDEQRGYFRSLCVEHVNIDGVDVPLADMQWHVERIERNGDAPTQSARFWVDVYKDEAPLLRVHRLFRLTPESGESRRRDVWTEIVVENLSKQPHDVIVTYRGGIGIPKSDNQMEYRVADVGVYAPEGHVVGARKSLSDLSKKATVDLFRQTGRQNEERLSWAATSNKYFTCTIAPMGPEAQPEANAIVSVSLVDADGSPASHDDFTLRFVSRRLGVAPGSRVSLPAEMYLGEKDPVAFRTLEPYKSRNYYYQVVKSYGFCTFTWLVELMIWLLGGIYSLIPNYGIAIIILVLIVRTALHPITKKGQVNMVRMQHSMGSLAPKIEEIKKKYPNDKAKQQQETMRVYREGGINPATQMLGCLPMVIQMPIWVALWISLNTNIEMRHQPFMLWIRDLAAPDALITFSTPFVIPFLGWTIPSLNVLPILMAVAMYVQQKLQPKPKPNPNASRQQREQQELMQKMMPLMSLMMLLFFYKGPSGLTLYIFASSLLGTIEQHRIRKHIREREEAGTLHRPARPADQAAPAKPTRFSRWVQHWQKRAEEAQRLQRARQRGRPRR